MKRALSRLVLIILTLVPSLVALVLAVPTALTHLSLPVWHRVEPILIDPAVALSDVRAAVAAEGVAWLDGESARVSIQTFPDEELFALSELNTWFDEADPRLDPFVRALPRLFEAIRDGQTWHVAYVPGDDAARAVAIVERTAGSGGVYRPAEVPLARALVMPGAVLAALFVAALSLRRVGLWIVPTMIPVALVAWESPVWVATTSVVAVAAWGRWLGVALVRWREQVLIADTLEPDATERVARRIAAMSLAAAVLVLGLTPAISPLLPPLTLSALALSTAGAWVVQRARIARTDHRLFASRSILAGTRFAPVPAAGDVGGWAGGATAALLVVGAAVALSVIAPDPALIPTPVHKLDEPLASEPLDLLSVSATIDPSREPISTAGYLAHRAHQASLMWGGQYQLPAVNESLAIATFRRAESRILREERPVFVADSTWIGAQIGDPATPLYRMLVEEGGVFAVALAAAPVLMPPLQEVVVALAAVAAWMTLVLLVIALAPVGRAVRSNT